MIHFLLQVVKIMHVELLTVLHYDLLMPAGPADSPVSLLVLLICVFSLCFILSVLLGSYQFY